MAANTNKRIPIKWVRDRAKAAYDKKDFCYICATTQELELHHTHSLTLLLNAWSDRKGYDISTDDGILAVRDEFIDDHKIEIYEGVFTLCNKHHVKLHGVYGKAPTLFSAPKQERWIELQKIKFETGGTVQEKNPAISYFGKFY